MIAGSVTINPDTGAETKSDFAGRIYDALKLSALATLTAVGGAEPTDPKVKAAIRRGWADLANAMASSITFEIQNHTKARVGPLVAGLQKTPNPNNADTATAAHGGVNIDLPLV
ncbi:MAG: hypothetical protein HOW73_47510 [Polyangiaceae bacterium]|nr:hypothetical protein [Polyangiaceae bacterium]